MSRRLPAVVVVAHDKPRHFHRLMAAIDPLPAFVHIDANTPSDIHAQMIDGLCGNVTLLPRLHAGWARYEVLQAELSGYRAALESTDAEHVILLTGADYPLASVAAITEYFTQNEGRSFVEVDPVPRAAWGRTGGADRFWFRQWPWGKRRMVLPVPRRVPAGVQRAGGSQSKVLCRAHAQYVLDLLDERPDLWRYFRRCWTPDEVTIHSLLLSKALGGPDQVFESRDQPLWFMDWGEEPTPSPHWLTTAHFPGIRDARTRPDRPALFARKLSDDSADLTDLIDSELRTIPIPTV